MYILLFYFDRDEIFDIWLENIDYMIFGKNLKLDIFKSYWKKYIFYRK